MSQNRNFGVTEASLGLTVIICLMVVLGYWVIQRLGGPVESPPVEVRASQAAAPSNAPILPTTAEKVEQPQVLVAEQSDLIDARAPHTAQRTEWPANRDALEEVPIHGIDGLLTPITPPEDDGELLWPGLEGDGANDRYSPGSTPVR
jgi:hypothetical protein